MLFQWNGRDFSGFWFGPAALGALLITCGLVIFAKPELLAYLVAAIFIFAGCSMLGVAWHLRSRVTYRRFDDEDQ